MKIVLLYGKRYRKCSGVAHIKITQDIQVVVVFVWYGIQDFKGPTLGIGDRSLPHGSASGYGRRKVRDHVPGKSPWCQFGPTHIIKRYTQTHVHFFRTPNHHFDQQLGGLFYRTGCFFMHAPSFGVVTGDAKVFVCPSRQCHVRDIVSFSVCMAR